MTDLVLILIQVILDHVLCSYIQIIMIHGCKMYIPCIYIQVFDL